LYGGRANYCIFCLAEGVFRPQVQVCSLGRKSYGPVWALQQHLVEQLIAHKRAYQQLPLGQRPTQKHYLLLVEHYPVYTLGRNGSMEHLLLACEDLKQHGFEFFKINRGGDITYHGPGQIVGYPIFDLDEFFTDVGRYVRYVEEAAIRTLADYGLVAGRLPGEPGVWLEPEGVSARKICAVGIHLSRWVTMHGFAFNVNTNLGHFDNIVPCGIRDKGVTSMQAELGYEVDMLEVEKCLVHHFSGLFGFEVNLGSIEWNGGLAEVLKT
jgi:lipoyl(octanoyl) transferase